MFELFIALFGGAYWGGKLLNDKWKTDDYNRNYKEYSDTNQGIKKLVQASRDFENDIKRRINCGKYREEIYDKLKDNLTAVFGESYREQFKLPYTTTKDYDWTLYPSNPAYWAKQLLLSKHGKVGDSEYFFGFSLGRVDVVQTNLKLCRQIENNLLQAGTGLKLVLQPGKWDDEYKWDPAGKNMIFEHQQFWKGKGDPRARLW